MQTTATTTGDTTQRETSAVEAQILVRLHLDQLRASKELWQGRRKRRGAPFTPRCKPLPPPSPYQRAS